MIDGKGPGGERTDEHAASGSDPLDLPPDAQWSDGAALDTGRLEFGDEDVRLPWLEADDDEEEELQGYNAGQLAMLIVLGLLAVAVIGGGVWWALGQRNDAALVADGSVIAAPAPYKEKPEDPGGKTFAGTGDTSYLVSEGRTRPARLGESAPKTAAQPQPSASAEPAAPVPSGVGVQVAAYSSRALAEAGWSRLSAQYEVLSGLNHRIVEGSADIGTVYRLQVLAGDVSGAHALCGRLKAAGLACQVKN